MALRAPLRGLAHGLSGAGKSTLTNLLEGALHASGHHAFVVDGMDAE